MLTSCSLVRRKEGKAAGGEKTRKTNKFVHDVQCHREFLFKVETGKGK